MKDSYFIYDGKTYNFVKEYEENEYDLTYTPIYDTVCNDIVEMSRLIYGFYEEIILNKRKLAVSSLSNKLILDLEDFFKNYEPHDLSYWGMCSFKSLGEIISEKFTYSIDKKTKELVLAYENVTVYIPESYQGVWGIDFNGEYHCIDETNINDFKLLEIEDENRFLNNYYMSEDQIDENDKNISNLISELCIVINKNGYALKGCSDLYNFYHNNM
jgi:hypothetical protein